MGLLPPTLQEGGGEEAATTTTKAGFESFLPETQSQSEPLGSLSAQI